MATLRELIIKISANSQSFQSEISRASRMGQDYYRTMQNGGRQAAAASRETQRALADLTGQLNSAKASAVGLAGAFAGAYATGHLISLADEWSSVNARLKQASKSSDDFKESQRALMDISQRTGTAFSDNASLFARSAASMREYGYSSEEVLKVTEAISTGLKLSGASTSEASSVITQFSQALAQGVLRGEEFNSVNENGDRVIRALASGMGVARKDLKAMADQGQLTADKVVPALISQLGALQDEYSAMPQTVASATTKIENAFLAWVGGANEATGATSALTGALNAISDNINTVASAAGVLAAIGGSRFIGGMIGDLGSQTAQLVEARKNEIALAAARASTATQSQRKAAADAIAAERAYQLAQSELVLAKNTNAEATATQNAISKRRAMITANAALVQSNRAVAASQQALNSATSVLGLVKTGATGLLGLVGGLPGLLMLGAGAWYTMYQNQEQARRSAQEYAGQIDEIRQKTSQMSLTETDENRGQTVEALVEQNRLVDEQAKKVGELKNQIDDLNASRGKPGITSENDANILKAIAIVTDQLAVEEGKLNDMRDKSRGIQQALEEIERRRNDLIREQAWRQNAVYQSMIMMNGQHTEFNRLLGLGNQLLMARQGLANVPLRLPQADLDKKQTDALEKSRRDLELSRRKGEAKERLRLSYAADDLGLTSDPQFQTGRQEFINNGLAEWRNNEANKPKAKGGKTEGEKTEDVYKRLIKQQKEQIALQGQNTELAKVKYQVSQGELASLTEAQKKTVLQNAALIDQVKLREQLRNYEANLADSNASARAANEAQLLGYGQGTRFRERLQEQFNLRKEFEQKNTDLLRQRQAGEIDETFYQQGLALNKRYLEERLRDQEGYYTASDAQRDDWMTGLSEGYANWVDEATDYSSMAADGMKQAMGGAVTTITDMLNGNVDSWKDWGVSVLKIIQNVLVNMAVANGVSSIGSLFSFGASTAATASSGTAIQNAGANFTFNAKGNVYDSPSLSAYSNGVFQTPQLFAFAKGAGVFAEAGPEAIMPLTRAPNGDLAVRAVGMPQVSGGVPSVNFGDINIQGGSPQASSQGTAGAAGRQLKDAITGVINEQASMPGSPLWRLIKGV
ncbi:MULTISPECIES: phage tail tape measure protein [Enterobacter]|uniref:phage tail tape measure protein n=1 Tax=Enterobacter TaxID=547 RepID=UPI0004AF3F2F|nr:MULTISPECIES: phage tail tape measure protein [Enterobacter]VAL54699.1 Phage tail length tape-measure protein 1 [Enterobacter kobei]AWV78404.1 phage tail tape measure protein [Enterobacter hormaechei subsp. xiangfangensis]EHF5038506.1 phage tail tape measure protein [Enterobacter hormaechei]KJP54309.1 lambda family phage tail tape measure protein [Enterobacter hormaechei subsp. steigerwaltii]KLF94318.1 lambda family phage tail tape measure protein [Enterobacter hormaechei subsp. steigerwalt